MYYIIIEQKSGFGMGGLKLKLNNTSLKPLYMQLKELLKEDIHRGKYLPGEQLPSESELCEIYQVSRITTRRAILDLVEEGVLKRQQGKGTFVTEKKINRELISFSGFSQFIEQMGKVPKNQILSSKVINASELIAKKLKIKEDGPVLQFHRLHFMDNSPMVIETGYYSLTRFPDLEKYIGENSSTYKTLRSHYQIEPVNNLKKLNVKIATSDEADLLKISQGDPLFEMEEIVTCEKEIPIHYSISFLPANKVTFTINTSAPSKK
jgi:GntR family transcriptional regulator, frlABCD operon transcriptional regulator